VKKATDQSKPNPAAIRNAATSAETGTIAPGSWTAIYGDQLADGTKLADTAPFPFNLQGVQVKLGQRPLPIYYVSATQVNALIPWDTPPNTEQQLMVLRGSNFSLRDKIPVVERSPGIYTMNQQGDGQGAILIANTATVAAPASSGINGAEPVTRLGYLQIYATGLGSVTNTPADGAPAAGPPQLSETTLLPNVTIGGISAPVLFSGLAPGYVGLYQVNVQVPANAPTGDAVSLVLAVGNAVSNTVTVAVK
jgi:uncharacterized protein (TIGR03437 family)